MTSFESFEEFWPYYVSQHQDPVCRRRRRLDGGPPALRQPGLVELVEHVARQQPAVGDPPGGELDARDLAGVVGTRRPDVPDSHEGTA